MICINEKSKCSGCSACFNICPKRCIEMLADSEGFLYPKVNKSECINCGKCEKACPIINSECENENSMQVGFAAYCKDVHLRRQSSSGGIFSLLAEHIISCGGVVFGAAFSDDCKSVFHTFAEKTEELGKFRGSKYAQSSLDDSFKLAKMFLDSGRMVLFTGTPCQISGLYSFLGKDYDRLFTQDLICHGVPSPLIWKKYVESKEDGYCSTAKKVCFRNKQNSWKRYSLSIDFESGRQYIREFNEDLFMQGFLKNIFLRPSCYCCEFKTVNRMADITLADFWGIQDILPDMDDERGTSFVWIHSEKGKGLFDCICANTVYKPIDTEQALARNTSAIKSAALPVKRQLFFSKINDMDIEDNILNCCKTPLIKRIAGKVKRVVKKLINR